MSMQTEGSTTGTRNSGYQRRKASAKQRAQRPAKPPKPMSATQRNKLATQEITTSLGLTDEKVAITAALEAVYERLAWDADLRERVREKYQEIVALDTGARKKPDLGPVPVPIRAGTPEQYTPYGKFDPYKLNYEYGSNQLRAVLVRGTQRDLREAADIVQARNPGTKPTNRSSKDAMIEYIMEHVVDLNY